MKASHRTPFPPFLGLVAILLFTSATALAKTHYVEIRGSNANPCTKSSPCRTIQHAINQARRNDKIIVGPGEYVQNLLINLNASGQPLDGLKLESMVGRHATILTAATASIPVVDIRQPRVQFGKRGKGFSVEGAASDPGIHVRPGIAPRCKIEGNLVRENQVGIRVESERGQVRYNLVKDNSSTGVYCGNCDRSLIRENLVLDNSGNGINIANAGDPDSVLSVERNFISGSSSPGIFFSGGTSAVLRAKDNVVELTAISHGITVSGGGGSLLQANIVARNGDGASDPGVFLSQVPSSAPQTVKNNLSVRNFGNGVWFSSANDAKVEGNSSIQNREEGIRFSGSTTFARLRNNTTYDNDNGGSSCGLRNDTGTGVIYARHYFSGGDGECGTSPLDGTLAPRPSPLRVNVAKSL